MDFERLLLPLIVCMGLNWLMFIPAYLFKTDKLTDISYSLTFLIVAFFGFYQSPQTLTDQLLLFMVAIWAVRLGAYLFYRIHKMGHDSRFDEMRNSIGRFLGFWTLQGITVFIVSIPFLMDFNHPSTQVSPLQVIGLAIFTSGLFIETIADWQKFQSKLRGNKQWVERGLWKKIRHPNYLGEILVWIGIYLFATAHLQTGLILIAAISPVFIILLLRYVSGIPLLEESHEKKWGELDKYQAYKKRTGLLLPKF